MSEVEVLEEGTDAELAEKTNSYNVKRDELRAIDARLSGGLDHTQKPLAERQKLAKLAEILETTDWIREYRSDVLAPRYRQRILDIATAKADAAAKRVELQDADAEVVAAEKRSYETWLLLRNTARASGQPAPLRFDVEKPKRHTGQISSWSPTL